MTGRIVSVIVLTFLAFATIGLPIAVLPSFVQNQLGFGSVMAGLIISLHYIATLLSRAQAGRMADTLGPKRTVLVGLIACGASGIFLAIAPYLVARPALSFASLAASRMLLGFGESWVGTGAIIWAIARVGAQHTSRILSWNGVGSYGAIGLGAPVGVLIGNAFGFTAVGLTVLALGALGAVLALGKPAVAVVTGPRMPFHSVFWRVLPHGLGVALGSAGFGTLATFVTLYYASRGWSGAALCLTFFGAFFVGSRLVFSNAIIRFGGFRVAMVSFAVEAAGLMLLFLANSPAAAIVGASLTGLGFALVFPALGTEAVMLLPAPNRGAAVGAVSLFFDIALGSAGPLAGLIASHFGYASIFLAASGCASVAVLLSAVLYARARPRD